MKQKPVLILDNDGTLWKFKNTNFSDTIWPDLKESTKRYIKAVMSIDNQHYDNMADYIKRNNYDVSEGYEKLWLDRKEFFENVWWLLDPAKYMTFYNHRLLKIMESWNFETHLITGAPENWMKKTLELYNISEDIFDNISAAEQFYSKKNYINGLLSWEYRDRVVIWIWDELHDIEWVIQKQWIWIKVPSSWANIILDNLLVDSKSNISMLPWWSRGCLLYNLSNQKIIKTIWFWEKSQQEIDNNRFWYEWISRLWGWDLIPKNIMYWVNHVELPYLWDDVTHQLLHKNIDIKLLLETVFNAFLNIIWDTKSDRCNILDNWSDDIISCLRSFWDKFDSLRYMHIVEYNKLISSVEIELLNIWRGINSYAIMPLDFTTDNIFLEWDKINFIDPWKQKNYLWLPHVSMAQFYAITHVYWFISQYEMDSYIKNMVDVFDQSLDIDLSWWHTVAQIWVALQYILSAEARYEKFPKKSKDLFDKSINILKSIIHE